MKHFYIRAAAVLFAVLMLLGLSCCAKDLASNSSQDSSTGENDHFLSEFLNAQCREEIQNDVPGLDPSKLLLIDTKGIFYLDSASGKETNATIRLFFNGRDVPDFLHQSVNSFLLVETESNSKREVLYKVLDYCIFGMTMSVNDIDGDKQDEIIIQQAVDATGGAGQYCTLVYKIAGNVLKEMLVSPGADGQFDTGFRSEYLAGFKVRLFNEFTGFETILDLSANSNKNDFYDSKGEPIRHADDLWIDSFYDVKVADIDNDGTFELVCKQYACLSWHANGIGNAVSTLKWNTGSQQFEVINASFEPDYQ